jgi:hypothetical protein
MKFIIIATKIHSFMFNNVTFKKPVLPIFNPFFLAETEDCYKNPSKIFVEPAGLKKTDNML